MPDLTDLIERIERADASEQRELLEDAYPICFPWAGGGNLSQAYADYWGRHDSFTALLDAEAYVDAALMLVPAGEGRWPQLEYIGPNPNDQKSGHRVRLWRKDQKCVSGQSLSSFALAIAAAALKARSQP